MNLTQICSAHADPGTIQAVIATARRALSLGSAVNAATDLSTSVTCFFLGTSGKTAPQAILAQELSKRFDIDLTYLSVGNVGIIANLVAVTTKIAKLKPDKNYTPTLEGIVFVVLRRLGIDPAKLTEKSRLVEDLGCDSLDLVELVMDLENYFGTEIPDEEAEKFVKLGDILKFYKLPS